MWMNIWVAFSLWKPFVPIADKRKFLQSGIGKGFRILILAYDHAKRDGDLSRDNVLRLARDYGSNVGITEPICKRALNMTLSEILGI